MLNTQGLAEWSSQQDGHEFAQGIAQGTYQGYQSQFNNRRNKPNSRNPRMHPYAMFSSSGTAYGKGVGAGMQPSGKGKGGKGNHWSGAQRRGWAVAQSRSDATEGGAEDAIEVASAKGGGKRARERALVGRKPAGTSQRRREAALAANYA